MHLLALVNKVIKSPVCVECVFTEVSGWGGEVLGSSLRRAYSLGKEEGVNVQEPEGRREVHLMFGHVIKHFVPIDQWG